MMENWKCPACGGECFPNKMHKCAKEPQSSIPSTELLAQAVKLLSLAQCPNCDGSGGTQISETECEQCQWCDEKNQLIARANAETQRPRKPQEGRGE